MTKITRIEVIDGEGRSYVNWEDDNDVSYQLQVKPKSPVEEAYKDWMGVYPPTNPSVDSIDDIRWRAFQMGYNAAYEEKVSEEPEENEWKLVALKLGEKLSDNGPGGYYDFTPGEWFEWALNECEREMIKRNLKTSLREMVNGDVRPIDDVVKEAKEDEEWNAVRESVKWCEENPDKDPLDWVKSRDDFMDKMVAELKGQTLTDIIWNWWGNVFTSNEDWDAENAIEHLVDLIEAFLPKPQSADGSQNAYVESAVEGYNDCINTIRRKLR